MNDCEKFSKASSPQKEDFDSHLNIENITDADNMDAKRVCKDFEEKKGEYQDLYLQSDMLLLAILFENFYLRYLS